ncbi:TetR/AcrR family transcriptional regulator [Rhodococcus sp. NPDC003318]|uniref:TetR/AcrR family transcriptional regulator n=1 Tax=Rhodococcus sp. NPDC003318 TaxID=3364503 RepID=UPI0036CC9AE0
MTSTNPPKSAPRAGSSAKRLAILQAARTVFGRDGYARASIDVIAAEAGASTRTLYNHFGGKEALFTEAMTVSSSEIAEAQIAVLRQHLEHVTDLESALTALGFDLATNTLHEQFADHFAIVRQINSEAAHFPPAALRAWRESGPDRVRHALAVHFTAFAAEGRLQPADPERAALHYLRLIGPERDHVATTPLDDAELREIVADGVRTFLYGNAARD